MYRLCTFFADKGFLTLCLSVSLCLPGCATSDDVSLSEGPHDTKSEKREKVVYAIKDIPESRKFSSDALEERELELSKIPVDAMTSMSFVVGRYAKHGVAEGQIVSQHDLALKPNQRELVIMLDDEALDELQRMAEKANVSKSELCQQWLIEKLRNNKKPKEASH